MTDLTVVDTGKCRACARPFDITRGMLDAHKRQTDEAYPAEAPVSDADAVNTLEWCPSCAGIDPRPTPAPHVAIMEAAGFTLEQTGGGCMAWIKRPAPRSPVELYITDEGNGVSSHPRDSAWGFALLMEADQHGDAHKDLWGVRLDEALRAAADAVENTPLAPEWEGALRTASTEIWLASGQAAAEGEVDDPPLWKREHPHFVLDVEIPEGWTDNSWGNDACPSWLVDEDFTEATLQVYVDYADPALSDLWAIGETDDYKRFFCGVVSHSGDALDAVRRERGEDGLIVFATNDWSEMLAFVEDWTPPTLDPLRTFEITVESGGSAIGHYVEATDARDALRRLLDGDFTGIDADGRTTIIVSPEDDEEEV